MVKRNKKIYLTENNGLISLAHYRVANDNTLSVHTEWARAREALKRAEALRGLGNK